MDEASAAGVNSHMRHMPRPAGGKKDKVPLPEGATHDGCARMELIAGVAGQIQSVESINSHGQTAAIETCMGGFSSPSVGRAEKPPGGPNYSLAEGQLGGDSMIQGIGPGNKEIADPFLGLKLHGALKGRLPGIKTSESHFAQAVFVDKIICIQSFLI